MEDGELVVDTITGQWYICNNGNLEPVDPQTVLVIHERDDYLENGELIH
jgi:hypothetical protein